MTASVLGRWLTRLAPERHKQAAAQAERAAMDSRQVMREVAKRHHKVESLTARMEADLIENHFAERVAHALGREHA